MGTGYGLGGGVEDCAQKRVNERKRWPGRQAETTFVCTWYDHILLCRTLYLTSSKKVVYAIRKHYEQ
jgi:hypothetical protein